MSRSLSDSAIVLSRTDYGEKDRLITVLSPNHGKLRAIAKGVRSGKSRLAGGIELFAENELAFAAGRSDLYTVTFSRMKQYFGDIAKDLDRSMYVYECLKTVNKLAPDHAGGDYYDGLVKMFEALNSDKIPFGQIKIWYSLQLLEVMGASPNFKTDSDGKTLAEKGSYEYDFDKHCFFTKSGGPYNSDHIKILRHLNRVSKPAEIRVGEKTIKEVERLSRLILLNQSA